MASRGILRYRAGDPRPGSETGRFTASRSHELAANAVYRAAFASLGMPLLDGSGVEYNATMDQRLGIDVLLRMAAGPVATVQEKFLFVGRALLPGGEPTVTVETMNDPATMTPGDWYTMMPQYLFIGYDYGYAGQRPPVFADWMLIDWPALARSRLGWRARANGRDGAKASFQYVPFSAVPAACVVRAKCVYAAYKGARAGMWSDR